MEIDWLWAKEKTARIIDKKKMSIKTKELEHKVSLIISRSCSIPRYLTLRKSSLILFHLPLTEYSTLCGDRDKGEKVL